MAQLCSEATSPSGILSIPNERAVPREGAAGRGCSPVPFPHPSLGAPVASPACLFSGYPIPSDRGTAPAWNASGFKRNLLSLLSNLRTGPGVARASLRCTATGIYQNILYAPKCQCGFVFRRVSSSPKRFTNFYVVIYREENRAGRAPAAS